MNGQRGLEGSCTQTSRIIGRVVPKLASKPCASAPGSAAGTGARGTCREWRRCRILSRPASMPPVPQACLGNSKDHPVETARVRRPVPAQFRSGPESPPQRTKGWTASFDLNSSRRLPQIYAVRLPTRSRVGTAPPTIQCCNRLPEHPERRSALVSARKYLGP